MSTIKVTNLRHESSASDNISLDSSGRVGIGTASPGLKFEVHSGTDNAAAEFVSTDARVNIGFADSGSTLYSGLSGVRLGADGDNLAIYTANSESARIDSSANFKFNSGYGSVATAYGCRAWVNFNGTGTVAIRASGNVSSITDNATGDYTVNFTTALADANYAVVATGMRNNVYAIDSNTIVVGLKSNTTYTSNASTSSFSVTAHYHTTAVNVDPIAVTVAVFR